MLHFMLMTLLKSISWITYALPIANIETLFAKLVQNEKEVIVGVVYRSPNCNFSEFLVTYKTITDQLPSKKFVQILDDFNVNLFKTNETMTSLFEEHFLSEGLYPTISIQRHKRDLTKGSCIDNIIYSIYHKH